MTRPLFLQRTARRNVHQFGIAREPLSADDLRIIDLLPIAWAVLFCLCLGSLVLVVLFGDRLLNTLCGG